MANVLILELERSSTIRTSYPFSINSTTVCEPIYPIPPVTIIFLLMLIKLLIYYQNNAYKTAVIIPIANVEILNTGLVLNNPPDKSIPLGSFSPLPVN